MYGYMYQHSFDPSQPSGNLLKENDKKCSETQLALNASLLNNVTYILVVTTVVPGRTGAFTIETSGASNITFTRLSEFVLANLSLCVTFADLCSSNGSKLFPR